MKEPTTRVHLHLDNRIIKWLEKVMIANKFKNIQQTINTLLLDTMLENIYYDEHK